MTIRLRCAECRRKLKVPDAARGRKVQCPVCGARFRESGSPSAPPTPPAETEPIDALFADTTPSAFSIPEDPAAPEEITIPAAPAPASPSNPNLELEQPPTEAEAAEFEPLVPEEVGIEEP